MRDEAALRIEITIRAAMIARSVLEMINMDSELALLQLVEASKQMNELYRKLGGK
jgi:hypothetical protein